MNLSITYQKSAEVEKGIVIKASQLLGWLCSIVRAFIYPSLTRVIPAGWTIRGDDPHENHPNRYPKLHSKPKRTNVGNYIFYKLLYSILNLKELRCYVVLVIITSVAFLINV